MVELVGVDGVPALPVGLPELFRDDARDLVPVVLPQHHGDGEGQPRGRRELTQADSTLEEHAQVHAGQLLEPHEPREEVGV